MKNLLKQYAKIEGEFRDLEAKREALREAIVIEMQKEKLEKVESDFGKFTIANRMSWTYSEAVTKLSEKLKIAKHKEELKGIAEAVKTSYLVFKSNV